MVKNTVLLAFIFMSVNIGCQNNISQAKTFDARQAAPSFIFGDLKKDEGFYYTVKKGDTLTSISKAQGVSLYNLKRLNKIKNPDTIEIGQQLFIPRGTKNQAKPNLFYYF